VTFDGTPRDRAERLLDFADGFSDGGGEPELAARARVVARDVLKLASDLDAERSARLAMQEARDRAIALLAVRNAAPDDEPSLVDEVADGR
jgi:hypothetical protein